MYFYPAPLYDMHGVVVDQAGQQYQSYFPSTPPIKVGRFFDVVYFAYKTISAILTDEGDGDE